jgi:rhomboid protease GluP
MAFGFSPKHEQTIELESLTKEDFIAISIEVVKQLEWNLSYTSEKGFIAYTKISMSSYGEELKITIENNTAIIKSECAGSQLFDWGKNKRNVESFISTFNDIKNNFTTDVLLEKYTEISQNFTPADEDILNQAPLNTKQKITGFFSIFKPSEGYTITPIILNLNLLVFIIMGITGVNIFTPENEHLLNWGANFRPNTLAGEWWRLFTCCFIHIGIFHLLMNMYALLSIGVILEPLMGKTKYLFAYISAGIVASLTSLAWNELTISAGASGAIFGLYGVFLALLTTNHIEKSARDTMRTSTLIFVGYNLINGLKPGIDNAAHIGGLLSGMAIGYIFLPSLKQPNSKSIRNISIGAITITVVAAIIIIFNSISNDIGKYQEKMAEFTSLEEKAVAVYSLPETATNEQILNSLNNDGIKNWEKCLKLIKEVQTYDLPNDIQERNKALIIYCEMRIECYQLIDKAITENTDQYQTMIDSSNVRIERLIKSLQ